MKIWVNHVRVGVASIKFVLVTKEYIGQSVKWRAGGRGGGLL